VTNWEYKAKNWGAMLQRRTTPGHSVDDMQRSQWTEQRDER